MKKTHDQLKYEREHAAEQDAGSGPTPRGGAVDAEREIAFPSLGERRHQQRERSRGEHRSTEPLQGTERDQRRLRPGETAQQRACGEESETGHEQSPAAEQVGEPPTEEQRAPKRIA